jgi:hypothetical protein
MNPDAGDLCGLLGDREAGLLGAGVPDPIGLVIKSDLSVVAERPEYVVAQLKGLTIRRV